MLILGVKPQYFPAPKVVPYIKRLQAGLYTRVWPLGDSITYGHGGSPNTNGYRKGLWSWAQAQGFTSTWDHVGTTDIGDGTFDGQQNGHPGYTIAQISTIVSSAYASGSVGGAHLCILLIGTNDISTGVSLTDMQTGYTALLEQISVVNRRTNIVACTLTPRQDALEVPFNAWLPTAWNTFDADVAHTSKLIRCDLNAAMGGTWSGTYFTDGAHPNNAGYGLITNALVDVLTNQAKIILPPNL